MRGGGAEEIGEGGGDRASGEEAGGRGGGDAGAGRGGGAERRANDAAWGKEERSDRSLAAAGTDLSPFSPLAAPVPAANRQPPPRRGSSCRPELFSFHRTIINKTKRLISFR
uniref:Uncharacterized protein n=1 Tax=Oryza rufipogon TaxID=4529 RepID=A0A0E0PAG3_ORYRU